MASSSISVFAIGDFLAQLILYILPSRISNRIRENTSPQTVLVLRDGSIKRANDGNNNEPRMTLFEGVFATLLFDLALFGTSNPIINFIIRAFTTIQNSWDRPFQNETEAESKIFEFCTRLDIRRHPWMWHRPAGEYGSLNDFFSRTYAPEYFPRLGDGRVVSPACCKISTYDDDEGLRRLLIKGCEYDVSKIGLPDDENNLLLEAYRSNRVFVGYLGPKDYHRVHSPISGKCTHCRLEGADSNSASVKFFGGKFNLLNDNKRLVVVLEEESSTVGGGESNGNDDVVVEVQEPPLRVALVIVGGVGVNTITYDKDMVGRSIGKGQEISTFRAGGRLVIFIECSHASLYLMCIINIMHIFCTSWHSLTLLFCMVVVCNIQW